MMVEAVDAETGDTIPPKNKEEEEEIKSQNHDDENEEYSPATVMVGCGKEKEAAVVHCKGAPQKRAASQVAAHAATQKQVAAQAATLGQAALYVVAQGQVTTEAAALTQERAATLAAAQAAAQKQAAARAATLERATAQAATEEQGAAQAATRERAAQAATRERAAARAATQKRTEAQAAAQKRAAAQAAAQKRAAAQAATQERAATAQERAAAQAAMQEQAAAQAAMQERAAAQAAAQGRAAAHAVTRGRAAAQAATQKQARAQAATQERAATTQERAATLAAAQERAAAQGSTQERAAAQAATQRQVPTQAATREQAITQAAPQGLGGAQAATQERATARAALRGQAAAREVLKDGILEWNKGQENLSSMMASVLMDRRQEQREANELNRRKLEGQDSWSVRQQRVWAAAVDTRAHPGAKRKALQVLKKWQEEREAVAAAVSGTGEAVQRSFKQPRRAQESREEWTQAPPRQQNQVADVDLWVGNPSQWQRWRVSPIDGSDGVARVDASTVRDWGMVATKGEVTLVWKQAGRQEVLSRVVVIPWERGKEGLWLPRSWVASWRERVASRPTMEADGSLRWEAELQRAPQASEDVVQRWWGEKAEEALRECLDPDCEELGGFFEGAECAPDERVLGSWVQEALVEGIRGLEHGQQPEGPVEMTWESNPEWARQRHKEQVFTAGRLHQFVEAWRLAGADATVLSWLEEGYRIEVGEPDPESEALPGGWQGIDKRNGGVAREHLDDFRRVVMDVLQKGAWEVVREEEVCNKMPMNLAPKVGKEPPWRLILNCKDLNEFVRLWSVRYETLKTVPLVVAQGDWLFSVDFTDAYYQIFLHLASQRLVGAAIELTQEQLRCLGELGLLPEGFVWDRQVLLVEVRVRPRGLPMGFRNSCAVWTKVTRVLTTLWRRKGFKLVHLLDDLLFSVSGTFEDACRVRDEVLADLERLGVFVNWKKSVLTPSFCLRFLGMLVDSAAFKFFVPRDKIEKLHEIVKTMGQQPEATVRAIASVVGKIMSMQIAVPAVRMVSAGLHALIRPEGDWDRAQEVTEQLVLELCEAVRWVQHYGVFGNPIRRFTGMTGIRIFVDAGTGYGWRIDGVSRSADFEGPVLARASEWLGEQQEMWQPWKELWALRYCLEEMGERLTGASVLVQPDATTTVAYVNKGSGPSDELTKVMKGVWDVCVRHGISIWAEHFEGERMIETGVDSFSRMAEFSVAPSIFRWLAAEPGFGKRGRCKGFTVDLYASAKTRKCRRYAEKGGGPGSLGDARVLKLEHHENYWVMPPLGCVAAVVMTMLEANVCATVVVPDWPDQPWHVQLRLQCKGHRFLRWHAEKPVMWDVCVKSSHHVHVVDKWDFVAFAVGGGEQPGERQIWRQRREQAQAGRQQRAKAPRGLWSRKAVLKEKHRALGGAEAEARWGQGPGQECRSMEGVLRRGGNRVLRVLALCNGCGAASLALEKLRLSAELEVVVVETDEECLAFTQWRFPEEKLGWSTDVEDWASDEFVPQPGEEQFWFDLVLVGFPCQDVSVANRDGQGLRGAKSALFHKVWRVIEKMKVVNPEVQSVLECTDFSMKFPEDFQFVSETVGCEAKILCASRISPCRRRRAFWSSFEVEDLPWDQGATPASVLEAGRWTDQQKLPTVVASGTCSWETREVVFDESRGGELHGKVPLLTVEMERAMGMTDGFTALPGLHEKVRHRMIGNSFHVGVIQHVLRSWYVGLQLFDGTLGFQGEGPTWEQRRRMLGAGKQSQQDAGETSFSEGPQGGKNWELGQQGKHVPQKCEKRAWELFGAKPEGAVEVAAEGQEAAKRVKGRKAAAWKQVLPQQQQQCKGLSLPAIFDKFGWGNSTRELLPIRKGRKALVVPTGEGFRDCVDSMVHDLVLCSRAEGTWKAYAAWVEVFKAFLGAFGVATRPEVRSWDQWVEVLVVTVAVLSQCYSLGTIGILLSAVSAYMQDYGLRSPYESRIMTMVLKGLPRHMGEGKKKKPPMEAWHVAKIVAIERPEGLTLLQFLQAKAIVVIGWELFTRSQDFEEFQICDFVRLDKGMRVLVRYAKNDQKGLTRAPVLEVGSDVRSCPVRIFLDYVAAACIGVLEGCTKVEGEPQRCSVCPPAFPSIHRHRGKQTRAMPKARVTAILRVLFLELASLGLMTEEEARAFSSKSMRAGGVTVAAAEAVRDGVIQGHGGWLHRQSLVHYDLMRESERSDVSSALNAAVASWL